MFFTRFAPRMGITSIPKQPNVALFRRRVNLCFSTTVPSSSFLENHQKENKPDATTSKKLEDTQTGLPSPKYYIPKAERNWKNPIFDIDYMVGETRLTRNSRNCPTRELYFLHTQWERHKSPYRKLRHMANLFRAAPFQRLLFPDLLCIGAVAGGLTYYNEFLVAAGSPVLAMSASAFAGATTAIGLLAGFRLNGSYGRVLEARKLWSDVNTATRNLARQSQMWVKNDHEKIRLLRLCQAFPITLLFHLNDKGCYHNMKRRSKPDEAPFEERVRAEFQAGLYDVYQHDPTKRDQGQKSVMEKDFDRLCDIDMKGGNVPLEVLTCMSEILANATGTGPDKVDPIFARELDEQIQILCKALGGSERIVKTPLPTGFTRHSSRLLFIWSNCLPFALYPLVGPLGTLPASILTSYAVLGIEDISVQLEEPFDILPLRQYSDSMYDGIKSIEKNYRKE
jgi:predicted membrane chloride channel (bestrophin family)